MELCALIKKLKNKKPRPGIRRVWNFTDEIKSVCAETSSLGGVETIFGAQRKRKSKKNELKGTWAQNFTPNFMAHFFSLWRKNLLQSFIIFFL